MADIDGEAQEVTEQSQTLPAKASDAPHQVPIFNPLDAEPVAFKQALISRSENYDALAMHIRGILVPDKDFGKIHVMPKTKCERPWECVNPSHFSPWMLFASGADKVLGLLGLGVIYPDEQDYRRATLKGLLITDVIIKAFIDNGRGQVISEGMGAATRSQENDDLNRTIKKACKRARLDAVLRLPAISALFEDDFLEQVARKAASDKGGNSTTSRQQQVKNKYDTGAHLVIWPLKGKGMQGERFDSFDDERIAWILREFQDKPDIFNAAKRVHDAREATDGTVSQTAAAPVTQGEAAKPAQDGPVTHAYDDYPEGQ